MIVHARKALTAAAALAAGCSVLEVFAQDGAVMLPTQTVVGTRPAGGDIGIDDYPGNAQRLDTETLSRSLRTGLETTLATELGSLWTVDPANNPYQSELFYRGYSASPLLGLPQGLSVYQDGVRINEPFGDVLNWDLVPEAALKSAELIPGSNPLYGLNTLGGAVSLQTRSGFDSPGTEFELAGGDYGLLRGSVSWGGAHEDSALLLAAEGFAEDGWRDFSRSEVFQGFARLSQRIERGQLDATLSLADNSLRGNGAVPIELLDAEGRDAVFTWPDQTSPRMVFLNLFGEREIGRHGKLDGGLYWRQTTVDTFNGDGTEFEACSDGIYLCENDEGEEEIVEDTEGNPVVASDDNDSATQNRSTTDTDLYGAHAAWTLSWAETPLGQQQLTLGSSWQRADIHFSSGTELAALTDSRGTVGSGQYVEEAIVLLDARAEVYSLFGEWRGQWTSRWQTLAGLRWNLSEVELIDLGPEDDLNGDHRFVRFNPMLGSSYDLGAGFGLFGSWSQSSRAPTPVELTCANPEDPCRLPNGFVDDPPLDEVVVRTVEGGLRFHIERLRLSLSAFSSLADDDIIFITDGSLTNQGYFDNVGRTRRQGIEWGSAWQISERWAASMDVLWMSAEFRDAFTVASPNHPLRDEADEDLPAAAAQAVEAGDRIPLVPAQVMRAGIDYNAPRFSLGLDLLARGESRYRGDEANADSARLAAFAIVNADGELRLNRHLSLFASVSNLFDRDYETFGTYGEADEVLGDDYEDAVRFVGPGAPLRWLAGLRGSW